MVSGGFELRRERSGAEVIGVDGEIVDRDQRLALMPDPASRDDGAAHCVAARAGTVGRPGTSLSAAARLVLAPATAGAPWGFASMGPA
jgi:hypothetical protein